MIGWLLPIRELIDSLSVKERLAAEIAAEPLGAMAAGLIMEVQDVTQQLVVDARDTVGEDIVAEILVAIACLARLV